MLHLFLPVYFFCEMLLSTCGSDINCEVKDIWSQFYFS